MVKERILILEDDAGLRSTLSEVLCEEGFEVCSAATASEAIGAAQEAGFDLIVADIRMAGMDGLEAVEAVRSSQPRIRTIVMTGYSSEADSVRALRLGVQDYLRKPFEVEEFLARVFRQIEAHRSDLRMQTAEGASRNLVIWSLENLLTSAHKGARGVARLAHKVAVHLGLPEPQAQECQILALAEYLRRQGEDLNFGLLQESLGQGLRTWLHQIEPEEEQAPLVVRLAQVALARMLGQGGAAPDQDLVQAFESLSRSGPLGSRSSPPVRHWGSLLTLAQALERSDPKEAHRIYGQLAQEAGPTQEGLSAHLGLARLEPERLGALTGPILMLARQVGPQAFAQSSLTLALMAGGQEGASLLQAAGRVFSQLPGSSGACRAQLAQYVLENRPADARLVQLLQDLDQLASGPDLQTCSSWLLPYVAEIQGQNPHPVLARSLLRQISNSQNQVVMRMSRRARLALVRTLSEQRRASQDALLRWWEGEESDSEIRTHIRALLTQDLPAPAPGLLRLHSLGSLQIYFGDEPLPDSAWSNRKQLLLLVFLAAFPGVHSEDIIIDRLWPDKDAIKGRNNINSALSHIRKVLKSQGSDLNLIQRDKRGVWVQQEVPHWHDVSEFQRMLDRAAQLSAPVERQQCLREACSIYRGPFLGGHYFDWADPFRQHLENRLVESLTSLSSTCLQLEQNLEALEHSHRLLELDPCCQNAAMVAMKAYLGLNRAEEAVRMFERVRRALWEELAMEPSLPLLELRQRALLSMDRTS